MKDQEKQLIGSCYGLGDYKHKEPPYQIESGAYKHAKMELDILLKIGQSKEDPPIVKDFIPEILALVNKFGHSGQSGGSAPYTASAISDAVKKLCLFKPICDITGDESEWGEPFDGNNGTVQNKRCSALFKLKQGKCYYLDAIVFKNEKGIGYSSEHCKMPDGSVIGSRQYIKSFPWKPKTFYIDVIEKETSPDDWEFSIKDLAQLNEVWEYYDRYFNNLKS